MSNERGAAGQVTIAREAPASRLGLGAHPRPRASREKAGTRGVAPLEISRQTELSRERMFSRGCEEDNFRAEETLGQNHLVNHIFLALLILCSLWKSAYPIAR